MPTDLQFDCPHCDRPITAQLEEAGKTVECPHCEMPFRVPLTETPKAAAPRVGRRFHFQCLRCGSVLEADSSQSGSHGRCPSCNATFVVPEMDERTGLARQHADPGDDGELPAPVHAYAAAGERAPKIHRREDDSQFIECSRCGKESPIDADRCEQCGLPFTIDAANTDVGTAQAGQAQLAVVMSIAGLVLTPCSGIGFIPGAVAVVAGAMILMSRTRIGRGQAMLGLLLGLGACIGSTVLFLVMAR